jgi:hypothetical protein
MRANVRNRKIQTTIRLPRPLYEQAKACVEKGYTAAENLNDFFIAAIQSYTRAQRRKRIDAAFASMANDAGYQREAEAVTNDFAESDWETLGEGPRGEDETHAAR